MILPDQMAILSLKTPLHEIDTATLLGIHERALAMHREGLLVHHSLPYRIATLRDERRLYALSVRGKEVLEHLRSKTDRKALEAILECALPSGWADEDDVWEEAFPGYSDRSHVRQRLNALQKQDLIRILTYPSPGRIHAFELGEKGLATLNEGRNERGEQRFEATLAPRLDEAVHHLLTVQAACYIVCATKGDVIRLWGDRDLRSETRQGRTLEADVHDVKLPDGRLVYRSPGGKEQTVDVEILTSKYTDEDIRQKYQELHPDTLFFTPTERLADRTEALVGKRPFVF